MARFVPKNPKLSKENREIAASETEGYYFTRIDNWLLEDQEKYGSKFEWRGYLSPSMNLSWDICMRSLIRQARKYNKMSAGGLRMTHLGKVIHEGQGRLTKWHPYLRYPVAPKFPNLDLRRKYERSKPEIPVTHDVFGWSGKIDEVLDIDGYPAIFDLKTCYPDPKQFNEFVRNVLPREKNVIQVCLYRALVVSLEYYERDPSHIGLGYMNVTCNPAVRPQRWEWWDEWNDEYEEKTEVLMKCAAYARREALLGVETKQITCRNPRCENHGVVRAKRGRS